MTSGRFMDLVEEYLKFRRGLGFDLRTPAWTLRSFARYADELGLQGHVTGDIVVQWARSGCPDNPARATRRLTAVRGFIRYLAMLDPGTEIPPAGLLGPRPRRKPPAPVQRRGDRCTAGTGEALAATRRASSRDLRDVLLAVGSHRTTALRGVSALAR
jgi:hypothetical protein